MRLRDIAIAATGAGVLSGLPSTALSLITRRNVLDSTRAAGTLLPGRRDRPGLVAGAAAHGVLSGFWTTVIATIDAHRPLRPVQGAMIGGLIAALDLGVIGRRYPAVRVLPQPSQWLDHLAFGALVVAILRANPIAETSSR